MKRRYYVYIMTNRWRTLYIGVTSDIVRRMHQHRTGSSVGFTQRYLIDRLVHVEACASPIDAIVREKQIKGWTRKKKIMLIESSNPGWADLAADWFDDAAAIPYRDTKDSSSAHYVGARLGMTGVVAARDSGIWETGRAVAR